MFLGCVLAIGAFGALIGYLDGRNSQVARSQMRLRILKESIGKGSGGERAEVEAVALEKEINAARDDGRAVLRARAQGLTWAGRAALIGLVPLGLWGFGQRLKAAQRRRSDTITG